MSVGCSLTSVSRNVANSEYLRLTCSSCGLSAIFWSLDCMRTHPRENRVCDITPPAFSVLPCIDDLDLQVRILVQYLLDATVVAALLGLDSSPRRSVVIVIDVAQVLRM